MNGAPFQHCPKCLKDRNFKWAEFKLVCTSCGYSYTPTVKEPVKIAAFSIQTENTHLTESEANEVFNALTTMMPAVTKSVKKLTEETSESRVEYPPQGYEIKHTPIEIKRIPGSFPEATNLRIFLGGVDEE